jgi:hypothetical protein
MIMETDDENVTFEEFSESWCHRSWHGLLEMAWNLSKDCARLRRELDEAKGVIR